MEKNNIKDYAEQLQQLCGSNPLCKKCIKRGKDTINNFCALKRFAFSLAKKKLKKQERN